MKAKLTDGTIIGLAKDCECITHSGPHWLHMDTLDKEQATEMLERGNVQGHISLELARLDRKLDEMISRGPEEIVH